MGGLVGQGMGVYEYLLYFFANFARPLIDNQLGKTV
jgi:hypothetical protein